MELKQKKHLRNAIVRGQEFTLAIVVASFLLSNVVLYINLQKNTAEQRNVIIQTELRDINDDFEQVKYDLDDLTSQVAGIEELTPENRNYFFGVQKCHSVLLKMPQTANYFILLQTGTVIKNMDTNAPVFLSSTERFLFFDYLRENINKFSAPIAQAQWQVITIGEHTWFILSYQYKGIYTGAILSASNELTRLDEEIRDLGGSFEIQDNSGTLYRPAGEPGKGNIKLSDYRMGCGLLFRGATQLDYLSGFSNIILVLTILLAFIAVSGLILMDYNVNRTIIKPLNKLAASIDDLQKDPDDLRVPEDAPVYELAMVQNELNELLQEVVSSKLEIMDRKMHEQQEQLRALRAQLRSHFYLNGITMVSNMTYQNRGEDIREYLDLLSKHMRYMMKLNSDTVELGEELDHVNNYVCMQNIRFPDSVVLVIDCAEELRVRNIPHLYIYTIVENAFKHALSLEDTLILLISCKESSDQDFHYCSITVEDNGQGFSEEFLRQFENGNFSDASTDNDRIGLNNIRQSLWLKYQRSDLLILSNAIPKGAKVELRIPDSFSR